MRAALGGDERVDFVDDDGVDGAQGCGGLGGEEQIERLGRGDEDVGRMAGEAGALCCGVSPVRTLISGYVEGDALAARHVGDAGERRAQVAFDVDG